MSRLEEKLKELGYEKGRGYSSNSDYYKNVNETCTICISVYNDIPYDFYGYLLHNEIEKQQDIDNLQLAFNEMQKDLEVLRNVE